jgi:putative flippase GtrA
MKATGMRDRLAHGAGFLVSGLLAFTADASVLWILTRFAGVDPYSARLLAILTAMVAAYFAHRRLTFADTSPPSIAQFAKFASVAAAANATNYAAYVVLLRTVANITPLVAMAAASAIAMVLSYVGFRFGVFRKS